MLYPQFILISEYSIYIHNKHLNIHTHTHIYKIIGILGIIPTLRAIIGLELLLQLRP